HPAYFALPFARSLTVAGYILQGSGSTHQLLQVLLFALNITTEHQLQEIGAFIVSLLREERQTNQDIFDDSWHELTGTPVPDDL
ncbi:MULTISPECIES: hypothetical protein, partial [unclassified Frankia]